MTVALDPLDLMSALVLESGQPWGSVAADWQLADAAAIFDTTGPRWHYQTRPRGGSKSTDAAAAALVWLAAEAPPGARAYVVAVDSDQAALLLDAAAGLVDRMAALQSVVATYVHLLDGDLGEPLAVPSEGMGACYGAIQKC
jgi:hypothetical protein